MVISFGSLHNSSQASAGLGNSNQKEWGLVRFMGVLSQGHTDSKALGDRGGCLSHGSLEDHIRNLDLLVTLEAVI